MQSTESRHSDEFVFGSDSRPHLGRSLRELFAFRECVWSFTIRSLRVRYKQAALGVGWAVIQPLAFLGIFIVFFGNLAGIEGGGAKYAAFAVSALVPWQFVSNGVTQGADALIQDAGLLRKVYFPREAAPLGAVGSYVPDLFIGFCLIALTAPLTGAHLDRNLVFVPLLAVCVTASSVAIAVPVGGLAIYYRDFKYALPFAVQIWLFASPVAYPITTVPGELRWVYALANPMVGPLEGFRRVFALGEAPDWHLLGLSILTTSILLLTGYALFKRLERNFADVV